jgi:hypothetical protein
VDCNRRCAAFGDHTSYAGHSWVLHTVRVLASHSTAEVRGATKRVEELILQDDMARSALTSCMCHELLLPAIEKGQVPSASARPALARGTSFETDAHHCGARPDYSQSCYIPRPLRYMYLTLVRSLLSGRRVNAGSFEAGGRGAAAITKPGTLQRPP